MQILVDSYLFQMMVECIEKQQQLESQPPEVQDRWRSVIQETYVTANTALKDFKLQHGGSDGRTETGMGAIVSPDKSSFV